MIGLLNTHKHPGVDGKANGAYDGGRNGHARLAGKDSLHSSDEEPELEEDEHQLEEQQGDKNARSLAVAEVAGSLHAPFTPFAKI